MIDVKFIRENPELVRSTCVRRRAQVYADKLVAVEAETRSLKHSVEINLISKSRAAAGYLPCHRPIRRPIFSRSL